MQGVNWNFCSERKSASKSENESSSESYTKSNRKVKVMYVALEVIVKVNNNQRKNESYVQCE